jgi:hypothetical protein
MEMMMDCEKCGRPVGEELKTCEFREDGSCPYQISSQRMSLSTPGCAFFSGVASVSLCLWMLTVPGIPWVVLIVLWGGVVVGAILALGGAAAALRKEIIAVDVDGERVWRQVTVLGKSISEATTTGFREVDWAEGSIRKLRFPASVVELARSGEVIPIVSTALTHLLNSGVIEVGVISTKGTMGSSKEEFFFMPGKPAETSEIPGALEQRMIEVVNLKRSPDGSVEYRGNTYQTSARSRLSLKDLLLLVFEGEKRFPRSWLMEEVTGKQAIELGFGELGITRHEKLFKFFDNTRNKLEPDKLSIEQMYKALWRKLPVLGPELHSQIDYLMVTTIKDKSFFI